MYKPGYWEQVRYSDVLIKKACVIQKIYCHYYYYRKYYFYCYYFFILSWQIYIALYIYTIKVVSRLNKVNYPT